MGTMTPEELLRLYTLEKITPEMALGHVLQNLVKLHAALAAMGQLKLDVERLIAFTGVEPERKRKEKQEPEDSEDLTGF